MGGPLGGLRGLAIGVLVLAFVATTGLAEARPTDNTDPSEPHYRSFTPQEECVEKTGPGSATRELCFSWIDDPNSLHFSEPSWVQLVQDTFDTVWAEEIQGMGYRMPRQDNGEPDPREEPTSPREGPNSGLDIYLADLGDGTTEGYCTSDRSKTSRARHRVGRGDQDGGGDAAAAYCVIDNDLEEFAATPGERTELLQATAAHEFFHAVQYAYDSREPRFLMEGTATWMEGQVFPSVESNHTYLDVSALHQPEVPLDALPEDPRNPFGVTDRFRIFPYGAWVFWQFLTELPPNDPNPEFVQQLWEDAEEGPSGDVVNYRASLEEETGQSFRALFGTFGLWNYGVGDSDYYADGADYLSALHDQRPPVDAVRELTQQRDTTGIRSLTVDHLSTRYVKFVCAASCAMDVSVTLPRASMRRQIGLLKRSSGGDFSEGAPFPQPDGFGDPTVQVALDPGDEAILVLGNGGGKAVSYEYGAGCTC